ncbi:MAG: carboxypeptidase regulatory-like domain-containing protein [Acidobacteria bacterium]|nr:MAG: carboxypeptidase regulatory-like domain-containing protein [Acidobacteriota bacterium]
MSSRSWIGRAEPRFRRRERRCVSALSAALLVCASAGVSAGVSASATATRPAPPPPSVSGQIVDATGAPLEGAVVSLSAPPQQDAGPRLRTAPDPVVRARTDVGGRFVLAAPALGLWDLRVGARGFGSRSLQLHPLTHDLELLPIALEASRRVSVMVVDGQGRGIAGARVRARPPRSGTLDLSSREQTATTQAVTVEAVTGNDGVAELEIPSGSLSHVDVAAEGFVPAVHHDVDVDESVPRLELSEGRSHRVCVVDAQGEPAPESWLTLRDGQHDELATVEVGDDGCRVVQLERDLRLVARSTGGARGEARPRLRAAETTIRLRAPVRVAGTVLQVALGERADDGEAAGNNGSAALSPVPAALVWIDPSAPVTTDARGRFVLDVPADTGWTSEERIRAAARGFRADTVRVDLESLGASLSPVVLEPTTTLRGVVQEADSLAPVAAAKVRLSEPSSLDARPTTTDTAGRFVFEGVRATESLELVAASDGYATSRTTLEPLGSRDPLDQVVLRLELGIRLTGVVLDPEANRLAGAGVWLRPRPADDESLPAFDEPSFETTADGDGAFEFSDIGEGLYDLRVRAADFVTETLSEIVVERPVRGPPTVDVGAVTMRRGESLEGRVLDRAGWPVVGAELTLHDEDQDLAMAAYLDRHDAERKVTPDDDGWFQASGFATPGSVSLEVERRGFVTEQLAGVAIPLVEPLEIVLAPAATLRGRVSDEAGAPIEARVELSYRAAAPAVAFTPRLHDTVSSAADGRFEIGGLAEGDWDLVATSQGFVPHQRKGIAVDLEAGTGEIELRMTPGAELAGTVYGADGRALRGARVETVVDRESRDPFGHHASGRAALTDHEGFYRLTELARGPTTVAVHHEEHRRLVRDVEIRAGDNRLDLWLEAGFEITGTVLDADGYGVGAADVVLARGRGLQSLLTAANSGIDEPLSATSDASGGFEFAGLSPGTYSLLAINLSGGGSSSFDTAEETVQVDDRSVHGVELRFRTGLAIRGRVLGLADDELGSVEVVAMQEGSDSFPRMSGSDAQGRFELDGLSAGRWVVTAVGPGGRSASESITLTADDDGRDLELVFEEGLRVSGRVLRGGEPVARHYVVVRRVGGVSTADATTDPRGHFELNDVQPGLYELSVGDLRGIVHSEQIEISDARELLVELGTFRLYGEILVAASGRGLAADLELEPLDAPRTRGGGPLETFASIFGNSRLRRAQSRSDGSFEFAGLQSGSYHITARADGYGTASANVTLEGGDEAVVLELAATEGLDIYAQSSSGQSVSSARVALLDANGTRILVRTLRAREAGRLHLADAPEGSWLLLVEAPGEATLQVAATVPGDGVRLVLPPAGDLRLSVPGLAEDSAARAVLRSPGGIPHRQIELDESVSASRPVAGGEVLWSRVPAGRWRVELVDATGALLRAGDVDVAAGQAVNVRLDGSGAAVPGDQR